MPAHHLLFSFFSYVTQKSAFKLESATHKRVSCHNVLFNPGESQEDTDYSGFTLDFLQI